MKCKEIIQILEELSPVKYAMEWDNVGLIVGRSDKEVKRIMIALDATEDVVMQCIRREVDMLITHHPMLFSAMKKINYDDFIGKKVMKLIQNDISYYAMHTNFDTKGMADVAAELLELQNKNILDVTYTEKKYKIAVFVPDDHANRVRTAMAKEGAGFIGGYSNCTFNTNGFGTFKPMEGTHPYIGTVGNLVNTPEVKIETIVTKDKLDSVVKAMLKSHPYEEVAYDVYELKNMEDREGIGRYGYLSKELSLQNFAEQVKKAFDLKHVSVVGDLDRKVFTVAISTGSGKSYVKHAIKAKADVLVTGDIDHHTAIDAKEQGLSIIDAGHYGTEHIMVDYVKKYLQKYFLEKDAFCELELYSAVEQGPFQII